MLRHVGVGMLADHTQVESAQKSYTQYYRMLQAIAEVSLLRNDE